MPKTRPQTVYVKRHGSKWEAAGTLAIAAAMLGPSVGWFDLPTAAITGAAGLLVFIIGRFL